MLDTFLPEPRLIELDHVDVAAPPDRADAAFRHFDGDRSPLIHALFALRALPERLKHGTGTGDSPRAEGDARRGGLRIDDLGAAPGPGFRVLYDQPGVGFALGAIGQFWRPEIVFADMTPATFRAFDEPGWGKVAWSIQFHPWAEGTRIVLELRVGATSEDAWQKVRRYFRVIGPFSHFIRRHLLSLLAKELGSRDEDGQTRPLPGDEIIPAPRAQAHDGITIDAPPERIWPWLVQLGCRRGGWYSYDLLDNAGQHSAREIEPDLQALAVGDVLPATPEGADGFTVLRIDPQRALVLGGTFDLDAGRSVPMAGPQPARFWRVSWAFVLEPLDQAHTRLHVRARVNFAPGGVGLRAAWMAPVHHFMQREQLRNLKRRAEGLPVEDDNLHDVGEGLVGALGMVANLATPFLRGRRSHWGLDEAAAARVYPGDALVPKPDWSWTHGVEIDAPAEAVWPWVVQIGQDKAGFYSYQWLENLVGCKVHNAERIHPEWQGLRPGDGLRLHPGAPPLPVHEVEQGRFFVASGEVVPKGPQAGGAGRASWLFFIEPLGEGRCRFISRYRSRIGEGLAMHLGFGPMLMEPIGFMMDRRMLLGVKERSERAARGAA